ncbi:MAG: toll/interleukin-1 receptor domain-containing protein [Xenococcaceae cyanobacterium]
MRQAIEHGDFFVACFSKEYAHKSKSYMNEELILAIEELRQYPTNRAWFIPVKLSDCEIPDRDIGAGETLRDIQWVDLIEDWERGVHNILKVISP